MAVYPRKNYILCQRIKDATKHQSTTIIETKPHRSRLARVISVGKNCQEVKPQQKILLPEAGYHEVELDNETYIVIKESNVMGIYGRNER